MVFYTDFYARATGYTWSWFSVVIFTHHFKSQCSSWIDLPIKHFDDCRKPVYIPFPGQL